MRIVVNLRVRDRARVRVVLVGLVLVELRRQGRARLPAKEDALAFLRDANGSAPAGARSAGSALDERRARETAVCPRDVRDGERHDGGRSELARIRVC